MPDLNLHGIGVGKKSSPMDVEILPYPKVVNASTLLTVSRKYVAYINGDNNIVVIDRKKGSIVSSFRPRNNTLLYAYQSGVIIDDIYIGRADNSGGGNAGIFWQDILNTSRHGGVTGPITDTSTSSGFYYGSDGSAYLMHYSTVQKFVINANREAQCAWQATAVGGRNNICVLGEYNGKLYLGNQAGTYSAIDMATGQLYGNIQLTPTSYDVTSGTVFQGKIIGCGGDNSVGVKVLNADGINSSTYKNLYSSYLSVIGNESKKEIYAGVMNSTYTHWTNKFNENMDIIETAYKSYALINTVNAISKDEVYGYSMSVYNQRSLALNVAARRK